MEDFKLEELFAADEVFISSTLKEIMPITHVDGKAIGTGKVGEETKKIQDVLYHKGRAKHKKPRMPEITVNLTKFSRSSLNKH